MDKRTAGLVGGGGQAGCVGGTKSSIFISEFPSRHAGLYGFAAFQSKLAPQPFCATKAKRVRRLRDACAAPQGKGQKRRCGRHA